MRLDASVHFCLSKYLHFISQQELRVMTAIELGMRNHEWVPTEVIGRIAKLRGGQTYKVLVKLLKNKFIVHTGKKYDGYKLAYLGYDYLALQTFIKRGILKDVIGKIGVGKESDVYKCVTPQGDLVVLKLTRLGRNSFRSVKKNRQYIGNRTNYNWLYLSRLSSVRQFLFMQLLHQNDFQTPRPIDSNRHAIVMSLIDGSPLCHIQRIGTQEEIKSLFEKSRQMLVRFAQNGLIHGDFNEFNLITNDSGTQLTVIDFPQCISVNHPNAETYFNRDVQCIYTYFDKMVERQLSEKYQDEKQEGDMSEKKPKWVLNVADYPMPVLSEIEVKKRLDRELKTKGHITLTEEKELENAMIQDAQLNKEFEGQDQDQDQDEMEENQDEENQESQKQEDQGEQKEQIQHLGKQVKKMSFDHVQGQLQSIAHTNQPTNHEQIYDKQLEALMSELNHPNLQPQFSEDPIEAHNQSQQEQPQRPQFKGLTAFQIRQKIKQEKRLQREKRKQQMTEDQYIKNAVKRSRRQNGSNALNNMLGNRGNKKKNRSNAEDIKYGYQLM